MPGAAVTTLPGYDLWVKDVNDKGGIMVKEFGKRIPVEVAAKYDDTSSAENLLRLEEKLMSQDKVDFVLPPWSTGFNLATAPIFAKYGYPHLAVTANSNDEEKLVKQFPTLFFFLNQPPHFGGALIEILNKYKSAGQLNNKVVLLSVGDQFGAEFAAGFGPAQGLRLRHRAAEELSAGRRRSHQRDQGSESLGRRHLRCWQLPARHLHADRHCDHAGI